MLSLDEVLADAEAALPFPDQTPVGPATAALDGRTPLHWMATLGDPAAIDLLLNAGAEVNAADKSGNTALHEAVGSRQHRAVKLLLARGADRAAQNVQGHTPMDLARSSGYAPVLEEFGNAS